MIEKAIVIGILARDCEQNISRNLERIEELRRNFLHSYVVIVENDSIDQTKDIILNYAKQKSGITVLSENFNGKYPFHFSEHPITPDMSCERIARMAFHRNRLIDYIEKHYQSDYVMFLDIDVLDFNVDGILQSIVQAPMDWGALFANGREHILFWGESFPVAAQYDTYALLFPHEIIADLPLNLTKPITKLMRGLKISRLLKENKYLPMTSAFGGIGLYKSEAIKGLRYDIYCPKDWKGYGISICEHIPFNKNVKGKCYISRDMEVTYHVDRLWNKRNDIKRKLLLIFFIFKHILE